MIKSFFTQNLKAVRPLGRKLNFFVPSGFDIQNHFDYKTSSLKPGSHKADFDHDNDQFWVKTKRLGGGMTDQPNNHFAFCVVVMEFAVNGN